MTVWFPPEGSDNNPVWWRALEGVASLTWQSDELPSIMPCEFMFMGAFVRRRCGWIWLYKHIWTRRYLNVDNAGHAYRYVPMDGRRGTDHYVPYRRLLDALLHLELEMPPDTWRLKRCEGCELCGPPVPVPDPG